MHNAPQVLFNVSSIEQSDRATERSGAGEPVNYFADEPVRFGMHARTALLLYCVAPPVRAVAAGEQAYFVLSPLAPPRALSFLSPGLHIIYAISLVMLPDHGGH